MKLIIGKDFEIVLKTARDFVFESGDVVVTSTGHGIKFSGVSKEYPVIVEGSTYSWDYMADRVKNENLPNLVPASTNPILEPGRVIGDHRLVRAMIDVDELGIKSATLQGYDIDPESIKVDESVSSFGTEDPPLTTEEFDDLPIVPISQNVCLKEVETSEDCEPAA